MTAPLKTIEPASDIATLMHGIGRRARAAARVLALAPAQQKNKALSAMAKSIRVAKAEILDSNRKDIADAKSAGATEAFLDRLSLDDARIAAMADGLDIVRELADPVGGVMDSWTRPNGMTIERVRVPLGVVGIIYESRPNVTADAGALSLKAGNAAILRGGSDSHRSSRAIHAALVAGLRDAHLPEDAIQLVPTRDREAVGLMLRGLEGNIDVIVPRGGKSLVARVQNEARVPVFAHLEGVCHVYVDKAADLDMAKTIVLNAKMRRTGVCGSAETLLVDRAAADKFLKPLVSMLIDAGCEVRGDEAVRDADARAKPASEEDWPAEYLDAIIAAKVVDGVAGAIAHIEHYGSRHTDAIVTADDKAAEKFLAEVDSAIVLHNASTQFADGGEFGFGAEIGIATGKMHARGPVGVEQLTSFKYRVRGSGQTRP
jgi:glutamate-5-semialdehyde dehydrogenase